MGACYLLLFPSGKVYVGITSKTANERFAEHCKARGSLNRPLYNALHKHGSACVTVHTLAESEDWVELCRLERHFIALFGSQHRALGYNCTSGGDGVVNLSEDSMARKKQASRENWASAEYREKISRSMIECWESEEYRMRFNSTYARIRLGAVADVPDYGEFTGIGSRNLRVDAPMSEQIRTAMGYWWSGTLSELSERASVSPSSVSDALKGRYSTSPAAMDRLAHAVGFALRGADSRLPFSEQCREAARASGMSQTAIAQAVGLRPNSVCMWIHGRKGLSLSSLDALSALFGWTLESSPAMEGCEAA